MKKIFSITTLMLVALALTTHATNITYTPDNTTVFPNPERGYTVQFERILTNENPRIFSSSYSTSTANSSFTTGNNGENANIRLALMLYYLHNFKSSDLPEAVLIGFDEDMQILRVNGWKCVLRFAYTNEENDLDDAELAWVQRHLSQLKSHLAANADVIYVMEAGFIGAWGEWYYTSHYGNHASIVTGDNHRGDVIDALFANAPTDRFILFRTPITKTSYLGETSPLPSNLAFSGSVRARWGHHNDAFLNNSGDMGTYYDGSHNDSKVMRDYAAAESQYVPNGGESNITDDDLATERYSWAPDSMSKYHWSFCGNGFPTAMTSRWRTNGQYMTMNIHMGYRYTLLSGVYSDNIEAGGTLTANITLENIGYAPIYNERPVFLVLKKTTGKATYRMPLTTIDPRLWAPNAVSTVNSTVTLPTDMYGGTYRLYLYLPDKYESIADDPRYAVRIASKISGDDVWDAESGMNYLGVEYTIAGPVEPIGPDDPNEVANDALSTAFASASAGDIIYLSDGIYEETSTINFNQNITIKAATGASPVIKPTASIKISEGAKVVFDGVKFDASGVSSHLIYASGTGSNCLVMENCELYGFANNSSAIHCYTDSKLDYLIVNNCKFYNDKKSCIFLENTDSKVLSVTNSSFYNITTDEEAYHAGVVDARTVSTGKRRVDHCTFYNCKVKDSAQGVVKFTTVSSTVSNNIFVMPETYAMRAVHVPDGSVVTKCMTSNYTYDTNGIRGSNSSVTQSTCTVANPLFANAASSDFTLNSSSQALNFADDGSHAGDPRWWPVGTNIHITIPFYGMMTYVATHALNFAGVSGLKAYVATSANAGGVTMTEVGAVPAWTPLVLVGTANATYNVPVISEAYAPATNLLRIGDECTVFSGTTYDYILYTDNKFHPVQGMVAINKAYLHLDSNPNPSGAADGLRIVFEENNTTGLDAVNSADKAGHGEADCPSGKKFFENGQLRILRNNTVYDVLGRIVK